MQNFKSLVQGERVEYNIHIRVHDGKLGYLASDVTGSFFFFYLFHIQSDFTMAGPGGLPVCGDPAGRFGALYVSDCFFSPTDADLAHQLERCSSAWLPMAIWLSANAYWYEAVLCIVSS